MILTFQTFSFPARYQHSISQAHSYKKRPSFNPLKRYYGSTRNKNMERSMAVPLGDRSAELCKQWLSRCSRASSFGSSEASSDGRRYSKPFVRVSTYTLYFGNNGATAAPPIAYQPTSTAAAVSATSSVDPARSTSRSGTCTKKHTSARVSAAASSSASTSVADARLQRLRRAAFHLLQRLHSRKRSFLPLLRQFRPRLRTSRQQRRGWRVKRSRYFHTTL